MGEHYLLRKPCATPEGKRRVRIPPGKAEIISAIAEQIKTLRRSYTGLYGKITDPCVEREIECLEAAIVLVKSFKW